MDNDGITQEQMTHFCEKARAAIAADRVTLIASTDGLTNLAASSVDSNSNNEVLAEIISDLARAIVSIHPDMCVTMTSINDPEGEPLVITAESQHLEVTQRVIEEEVRRGNVG